MTASAEIFLTGEEGMLAGETLRIGLGESVLVGRSRTCDLSTRRSRRFLEAPEEEQLVILEDRDFLRVSRQHVRITFLAEDQVEIHDLSRNGTFVNGERVGRRVYPRPDSEGMRIRLARVEILRLSS